MNNSPAIQSYGESKLADIHLGRQMIEALEYYYPRHAFYVECNHEAGVITIQLLYQDKKKIVKKWKYGMLIHINSLLTDDDVKRRAMLDGGELLERYRLARSGANPHTYIDAANNNIIIDGMIK